MGARQQLTWADKPLAGGRGPLRPPPLSLTAPMRECMPALMHARKAREPELFYGNDLYLTQSPFLQNLSSGERPAPRLLPG